MITGSRAGGFERDDDIFEATCRNLSLLDVDLALHHVDYLAGLEALVVDPEALITPTCGGR